MQSCPTCQTRLPTSLLTFLLPICGNNPKAILRRPDAPPICRYGASCPKGPGWWQRRILADPKCGTFGASRENLDPLEGSKNGQQSLACSQGRGLMATGRTKLDAIPNSGCAFVIDFPAANALHYRNGVFAVAPPGALGAPTPEPFASHGATRGGPARRAAAVGARRRGDLVYGYKAHVGGCHPPGRNTDRRHQR